MQVVLFLTGAATRHFQKAALLAGSLTIGPAMAIAEAQLTVTSWGGSYAEAQQKAFGAPFESEADVKIRWETYSGGLDEIRRQVEAGDVSWDVVDVFANDARTGCPELFEELPNSFFESAGIDADLIVSRPNDCVAPNILWSWITAYRVAAFPGGAPTRLSDFFDLQAYPGRRAISAFPQANLEIALVADGVPIDEVYTVLNTEAGVDRAFRKLDSLRSDLVFWSSGEEPLDLLRNGDVTMAVAYNGRISAANLDGDAAFQPIWDGQVLEEEWFVIPRGSRKLDQALAFLRKVAEPAQQAAMARWITYGPMRASALEMIANDEPWFHTGDAVIPHLPTTKARLERTIVLNPDWWATNGDAMTERFGEWRRSIGY